MDRGVFRVAAILAAMLSVFLLISSVSSGDGYSVWDGTASDHLDSDGDTYYIRSAQDLAFFADDVNGGNLYRGKTVELEVNIDLNNLDWTPIGHALDFGLWGTFDGKGHEIINLRCHDKTPLTIGLFGTNVGVIKNLTVRNVDIFGGYFAGGICGWSSANGMLIENCHVENGSIVSEPRIVQGNVYDDGDNVGGICGYAVSKDTIRGCSVKGLNITAYRDAGSILGHANGEYGAIVFSDNSAENCTVTEKLRNMYETSYGDGIMDTVGPIVGRNPELISGTGNTYSNIAVHWEIWESPDFLKSDVQFAKMISRSEKIHEKYPDVRMEIRVNTEVKINGNISLKYTDLTIEKDYAISIESDVSFVIEKDVAVKDYGSIINSGFLTNNGSLWLFDDSSLSFEGKFYNNAIVCDNSSISVNLENVVKGSGSIVIGNNAPEWNEEPIPVKSADIEGSEGRIVCEDGEAVIITDGGTVGNEGLIISFEKDGLTSSVTFEKGTEIRKNSFILISSVEVKKTYDVEFINLSLELVVTISLPCNEPVSGQNPTVNWVDDYGKILEEMGGTYSDGHISFTTNHNSRYEVVYGDTPTPTPTPTPEPIPVPTPETVVSGDFADLVFISCVAVAVTALFALAFIIRRR